MRSSATPAVTKVADITKSDVESPAAPPYSPLTPLVTLRKTIAETCLDSPAAPAYSPVTPLATRKEAEKNNSPIPPMSPSTLELFETLSQDLSTVDHAYMDLKEDGDYDDDTESDYVPDSGEETDSSTSSVKQKRRKSVEIPESDSSENETITEGLIQTHVAMVHDNQSKTDRTTRMRHDDENQLIVTNAVYDDITVGEIISICQSSDTEVQPETEVAHPITENNDTLQTKGRSKCGRKRKHPEYCISEKKGRKYMNLPYHVKDKLVESKVFYDYTCTCKQLCHLLVPTETRKQEFDRFVTLGSYEAQLLFILNNVKESEKARSYNILTKTKTGKSKPRQYRRNYYIAGNVVCKQMFLKNFQISSKRVDTCLTKKRTDETFNDKRGLKQGGWNKTPEEDIDFVKNIINSLPKYESHYRRERNNGTQYLKLGMTIQKIYDIYLAELKQVYGSEKKCVSFATLKHIFYTNFNLRCKPLKKDTCKKCDLLALEIKKCCVPEEKEQLILQRDLHQMRAEELRKQMSQDMARAKTDPKFECLTYDLEKTLPLPRIPTNIVFYKRQLWVYNAGIHVGSNDQGRCNIWVEGEAGRGAQEVGSCLINFIKNDMRDGVENLVLWSDCCGGQNRNIKIILMLKTVLNSHPNLETITFKYLESGHSFLPNDTDFSKIECELKHHERIYTVEEYMNIMKICKKKNPLQVIRMNKQHFLSTKHIEKKIVNRKICTNKNKVNWLKTKQILLKKEDPYLITMTLESGEIQNLDVSKKSKGISIQFSEEDFDLLWPQGKAIPQAKLEDLRSMYSLIPEDCHEFYDSLKGNSCTSEYVDGYGPSLDFDLEDS